MVEMEALYFFEGSVVPGNKNYQDNTVNIKNKILKKKKTIPPGQCKDTVGDKSESHYDHIP